MTDALKELLAQLAPQDRHGRTYAEVVAEALVKQAAQGNAQAAREIMDRTEGGNLGLPPCTTIAESISLLG